MFRRLAIFAFIGLVLVGCSRVNEPMAGAITPTAARATSAPAITPIAPQTTYLSLMRAEPSPAAALPLHPTLRFTFNKPLDRASLQRGWQFTDQKGNPIAGKVTWLNDLAFSFTPTNSLKGNGAVYLVKFTKDLRSQSGSPLDSPITLTYKTEPYLTLNAVYPADGSDDVPLNADITLVFSKPMVPLTGRESEAAAPLPLSITPSVTGSGRWVSSAVYVFHPSKPLRSNTDYEVALPAGVKDLAGDALPFGKIWRFHTETVRVSSITVEGWHIDKRLHPDIPLKAPIDIWFSTSMDPAATEKAVVVTAANGGKVPSFAKKWDAKHTILTLEPQDFYSLSTTYTVSVNSTARAADGGYLSTPAQGKFRTVGLPWVDYVPEDQSMYSPWETVYFNTYMDEKSFKGRVVIKPTPSRGVSIDVSGTNVNLGIFDPATTYTVTFLPGIADIYGNKVVSPITFTFRTAPLEPQGDTLLPSRLGVFHADQPQVFYFRYANLDKVTFTLYPLQSGTLLKNLERWTMCKPTGTPIGSLSVGLGGDKDNKIHYLKVDLAKVAGQPLAPGAYCLQVERSPKKGSAPRRFQVVVATENLTIKSSPANALVWATDFTSGAPVGGLKVDFFALVNTDGQEKLQYAGSATTNGDGVAILDDVPTAPRFALVNDGGHFALVDADWTGNSSPESVSFWEVMGRAPTTTMAFVYTDRPLYRPGQQIFFKGILRQNDDLHYTIPHDTKVVVELHHEGKLLAEQTVAVSDLGTFHGSFLLADAAPVGNYAIWVRSYKPSKSHEAALGIRYIRVANYHKPVFEVDLKPNPAEVAPGSESQISLQATYYAGDAVADADVSWQALSYPFYFTPPRDYENYTFSNQTSVPWLWGWLPEENHSNTNAPLQSGTGKTDAQGKFTFAVRAPKELKDHDEQVTVWATVTDRGGNSADGHTVLISRLSNVYVGLKTDSWLGVANQPTTVSFVVLDPQGNPLPNHTVHLSVIEETWHSVQRLDASGVLRWENSLETTPIADLGDFTTGADGKGHAEFTPPHSGTFRIIATATDSTGKVRKASVRFWVLGAQEALLWGESEAKTVPLIPDRAAYRPGEVAHIAVPRAFNSPIYALMTEERGKIYSYRLLRLDEANSTISVPINERMAPMIYISVVEVRGGDAKNPPDYRIGTLRLPVDLVRQRLKVTVTPEKPTAAPGETVRFTVRTTTYDGSPVSAEVSLALVDKALLAIAPDNYSLLNAMYSKGAHLVATASGLAYDALAYNLKALRLLPTGPGMGGGGKGLDQGGVITVRENFRDTAYWKADLRTNADGVAEVSVTLPDNMTTWVMHARAVTADSRVGSAVAEVQANLPFFVRLHTPAFFTAGDKASLAAVVHNSTDEALTADVSLTKAKGLRVNSPISQKVEVPPKGQAIVWWDVSIPLDAQRVDLAVQAVAGNYRDASRPVLTLLPDGGIPVYRFTTVESVGLGGALFGVGSVREFVLPPKEALHYTLRLNLAGSVAASVSIRAEDKPAEPSRCVPSNAFALMREAAVLQMRAALHAQPSAPDVLAANADKHLQALMNFRRADGTWGWCADSPRYAVMPTAYALDALVRAREAGISVDETAIGQAARWLSLVLVRPQENRYLSLDEQAYIADVLARAGRSPATAIYTIAKKAKSGKLSTGGKALLLRAALNSKMGADFTKQLVADLESRVVISAAGAHWDGSWWSPWGTSLTATALAVDALLKADPKANFMPNAVRWLTAHYNASRWLSELSDAAVLNTLSAWVNFAHESDADYDYGVFLGGKPVAKGHIGRSNFQKPISLSWDEKSVPAGVLTPLDIQRGAGKGALYYTAYLETTLPASEVKARNDGLQVERAYYVLPDLEKPVSAAKSGSLVQVRLTITVPHSADNVILTDYLPAGLEALSNKPPIFVPTEQNFAPDDFYRYGWGCWWFGHREVYYDHVIFRAKHLEPGTYTLVYYARAAVPGEFQVRPAVAWESFFPDVRGRTAGGKFVVKP